MGLFKAMNNVKLLSRQVKAVSSACVITFALLSSTAVVTPVYAADTQYSHRTLREQISTSLLISLVRY